MKLNKKRDLAINAWHYRRMTAHTEKKCIFAIWRKKEAANAYNVVISHILSEQNIFSVKQICVMQPRCSGSFSVVLGCCYEYVKPFNVDGCKLLWQGLLSTSWGLKSFRKLLKLLNNKLDFFIASKKREFSTIDHHDN